MKFNWVCCRFSTLRPPCSLFRFFPFASTSPGRGGRWYLQSSISAKKIWRTMVSQPLHIWDLWWFYRFIDRKWLELWGHPFSDSVTQFQGFLRSLPSAPKKSSWYEWALEPLATLFLLASNGCSASLSQRVDDHPVGAWYPTVLTQIWWRWYERTQVEIHEG